MSEVTIRQLADVVGIPLDRLIAQLGDAGLAVSGADDVLNDDEKLKLLSHLRHEHGKQAGDPSNPTKKVTLKRRTVSELKQGRIPGRGTKTVSVEVRKRRTYIKRSELGDESNVTVQTKKPNIISEDQPRLLDVEEAALRRKEKEIEAKRLQLEEEQIRRQQEEEAAARKAREALVMAKEEAKRAEQEQQQQLEKRSQQELAKKAKGKAAQPVKPAVKDRKKGGQVPSSKKAGTAELAKTDKQGRGKQLHVSEGKKRQKKKSKVSRPEVVVSETKHGFEKPTAPIVHEVILPETVTVSELAQKMTVKATEVIKVLMGLGVIVTINQSLDQETASIVVEELGHKVKLQGKEDFESELLSSIESNQFDQYPRAPVVTIMGHVDHGKTSLLDYIRNSRVAAGEAGGITQHIGAYQVKTDHGAVTFLDTPGHAAFTAMRARGAQATDVVILVVAADDGVMPQTKEAVEHSRAAGVPILVAVNKIDKADAEPERVKQELVAIEVVPEEWGGDCQFINVSAKTGEGVDAMIEALLLQAEILELKAPIKGHASGVVVESKLDRGRGAVATVLVQKGTLNKGDIILCGQEYGHIRAMFNEHGKTLNQAGPSAPVEILGLSGAPGAGDDFSVVPDERTAREIAVKRSEKTRSTKLAAQQAAKLEQVFSKMESGKVIDLNLIVKADVQGSLEALRDSLTSLSNDEVRVNVIAGGVGGINEGDANLALASNAIIVGFNVRADSSARKFIEEKEIDLHYYSVIYEAIDEVKKSISGLLSPEIKEQIVGNAEVRDIFRSPKLGAIAGCMVTEGHVMRNLPIRVLRDNVVIFEGQLESLRRFKDDVPEVKSSMECGIGVKNYNDIKVGDQIEVYEKVKVQRTI